MATEQITSIKKVTVLHHPGLMFFPDINMYKIKEGYNFPVTACTMMPNDMGDCEEYKLECSLPENSTFYCRDDNCKQIVSSAKSQIHNKTYVGLGSNGNRDLDKSWEFPYLDGRRVYTL